MEYILQTKQQPTLTKLHKSLTDDNYLTHIIYANRVGVTDTQKEYHLAKAKELIEQENKDKIETV